MQIANWKAAAIHDGAEARPTSDAFEFAICNLQFAICNLPPGD
jgi:hypothetical protein